MLAPYPPQRWLIAPLENVKLLGDWGDDKMRFELRRWVDQRRIPKSIQLIPADITDFLPTKEHDDHEFHVMP